MNIYKVETPNGRTSIEVSNGGLFVKAPWHKDFLPMDDSELTENNTEDCKTIAVSHNNDDLAVLCVYSEIDGARLIPVGDHKITIRYNGVEKDYTLSYHSKNDLSLG